MSQSKKEMMNRALSAMTINIGKGGVNDNVIEEIKRQLKANEIVKLKFAKNITRKRKLLEKQKEGKKKMRSIGSVEVPSDAFVSILKID